MEKNLKGIILAGGSGTRLYPVTKVTSKQLLPIHDKPMIYYPLSTLMLAGIKNILIISTPTDTPRFQELFQDGSALGLNIQYAIQLEPKGLAQAFTIGEKFIGNDNVSMILGDNIFHGEGIQNKLAFAKNNVQNGYATIYGFYVNNPERFGVVEFDQNGNVISIEEKPKQPKSNYAATGLYFYDNNVIDIAKDLKPSPRGELEITDINETYRKNQKLKVEILDQEYIWFDTGTHDSLTDASYYIYQAQNHTNKMIGCPEEIAYNNGWITKEELIQAGESMRKNKYGQYLLNLATEQIDSVQARRTRKLEK